MLRNGKLPIPARSSTVNLPRRSSVSPLRRNRFGSACSAWLSWKCQIASGTAREHVRVARRLGAFPEMTREFAAGRLSYAKVRALTRIAAPETWHDLVAMPAR
jgi:hypothetical protein